MEGKAFSKTIENRKLKKLVKFLKDELSAQELKTARDEKKSDMSLKVKEEL